MSLASAQLSKSDKLYENYDYWLLVIALILMVFGMVVVTSASIPIAERLTGNGFYFATRHGIYLCMGILAAAVVVQIPVDKWQKHSAMLLFIGAVMLILVLLPVIGRNVNGSSRWLNLGGFTLQVSELMKLFTICYVASFLVRKLDEVRSQVKGFIKPLLVMGVIAFLLLLEPDFGATAVISVTVMGMLFLAGAKLWQFILLSGIVVSGLGCIAVAEPYRWKRLTSFLEPWNEPFGSGYQLSQSLIAFGRGEFSGLGLGNSIQKLEYLPEAHTDFVVAILAEEFGWLGVVSLLVIYAIFLIRGMSIGRTAVSNGQLFSGYVAFGIVIWFSLQVFVNIGASAGLLPTKGLTLPLISYGGTSLIVSAVAVALLIRISFESTPLYLHGGAK